MRRLCISLGILLGLASPCASQDVMPGLPADQLVARVNGVELRGRALNQYLEVFLPSGSFHGKVRPDKLNLYRRQALERMILHELVYQDAVRRGIKVPASKVEDELARKRHRFQTAETFERAMAAQGLTVESLRTLIRHNLMINEVVRRDITKPSQVSDKDVRAYYSSNLKRFRRPESVQVRHILISPGPEGARQADEVRRLVLAKNTSEEFDRLAWQYSQDDYRVKGGMLGWIHRGRLEQELDDVAFALRPGEVSEVIQTSSGYHLLRVEAKRPERLLPLEEVKDRIRAQLESANAKKLRKELEKRLYASANVEILARL